MKRTGSRLCCLVGITACIACGSDGSEGLGLDGLSVSRIPSAVASSALLQGQGFFAAASLDLNSQEANLDARFQVLVGSRELAADAISRQDGNTFAIDFPAGLPLGLHDITLIGPGGKSDVLDDVLLVEDPTMHIEDRGDGSGISVDGRRLDIGDSLELFAVSRFSDGDYFRSEAVTWSYLGSGASLVPDESSATLSVSDPGTSTIRVESLFFGSAVAAIQSGDCMVAADCGDDPCRTESCVAGLCEITPIDKDTDGDSFVDIACGGDDCDDDDILEHPGQLWYPDGDSDLFGDSSATPNSCLRLAATDVLDGTDCNDASSLSSPGILEGPAGNATCSDSLDNDCDSATDGADSGCLAQLFTTPVAVAELAAPGFNDDSPTVTTDLLEIYFNSSRPGGVGSSDIWVAVRGAPTDPWGTPTLVTELSTADREETPEVSGDGLRITFQSDRPGSLDRDIWISTRAARNDSWGAPVREDVLSSANKERAASENSSGLLLVLNRQTGNSFELFERSDLAVPWTFVRILTELVAAGESNAFLVGDQGLMILFTSGRAGGLGMEDLYMATRPDTTSAFDNFTNLTELNTTGRDQSAWAAPDLSYIIFVSDRSGDKEIYEAFLQ